MYSINNNGLNGVNWGKKNVLQIFFIGIPLILLLNYLRYWSHKEDNNGKIFFLMIGAPLTVGLLLLFVLLTIRTTKRLSNTISQLDFKDNHVLISNSEVLWVKPNEYKINISELNYKNAIFKWYGKKDLKGIKIHVDKNVELYLVETFFDDYETILNKIKPIA